MRSTRLQAVATSLRKKYQYEFSFFTVKGVNNIVHGKNSQMSRKYTDLQDYVEEVEYLKKYYRNKNKGGKEQIKDRMTLLKNFYGSNRMLTYEYPMMVVNSLEDLFRKRHDKIGKLMKNSEQEDSEEQYNDSQGEVIYEKQLSKKDQYLEDLEWSDIIIGKFDEEHFQEKETIARFQIEFSDEEQSIFENQKQVKKKDFLKILGVRDQGDSAQLSSLGVINEKSVSHLIMDFDDLDRNHILEQYERLANKENINNNQETPNLHKIKSFLDIKKPLSDSICVNEQSNCKTPESRKSSNVLMQSLMIGSREERQQERQMMKKSSLIETGKRNFIFTQDFVINQSDGEDSPLFGAKGRTVTDQRNPFQRNHQSLKFQRKEIRQFMKHSQCIEKSSIDMQKGSKDGLQLLKQELKLIKQRHLELFGQTPQKHSIMPVRKVQSNKQRMINQLSQTSQATPKILTRTKSLHLLDSHDNQRYPWYRTHN